MTFRTFCSGLLIIATVLLISGTVADPDLWGHVRFGNDIIALRAVRVPDVYSFTTDRPWVNHEWLSEVAMAASYDWLGPAGLNLLRIGILGCVLALAWNLMPGVAERQKLLVVSAGAMGLLWRGYPVRPQLFSLLFFAILLRLMAWADERRSVRPLAGAPVLMAVWVNLHGGWIVGLGTLCLWAAVTATTATGRQRARLLAVVAVSTAATLVNPYGLGMWNFLLDTVRLERPMISDWQPLYHLPWVFWAPWVTTLGVLILALAISRNLKDLAIAGALGLMAFRVSRLDAFFAISVMFLMGRTLARKSAHPVAERPAYRSPALAWGLAGLCIIAAFVIVPRVVTVPVAPGSVPDANVARYVRSHQLKGTVLIWFDWGEYAIWQFGPELRVSMDGRRETVYGPEIIDAHTRLYAGEMGATRYADELRPDYIWLPVALPVVNELRRIGWRPACSGPTSILLTRRPLTIPCSPEPSSSSSIRVFPEL